MNSFNFTRRIAATVLAAAGALLCATSGLHAQSIDCYECPTVPFSVAADACVTEVLATLANGTKISYVCNPGQTVNIPCVDGMSFALFYCIGQGGVKLYRDIPPRGCVTSLGIPSGCCVTACLAINECWKLVVTRGAQPCVTCAAVCCPDDM